MIGLTVGRYRILARLGPEPTEPTPTASTGLQSSLWKAEDTLLRRSVALKVLSGARKIPYQARQRFLGEARAATALDHPRIAAVLDFGQDGDLLYIASQFVEGETIQDRVRRAPLNMDAAVRIAHAAVDALGIAHAGGVVHGDVSPENILLVREGPESQGDEAGDGAGEQPVLVGFCFALLKAGSVVTRSRMALRTAGHMAPELLLGRPAEPRSDLYGLGAVLYLMLTGKLPFDGDSMAALLESAVRHEAEAPSLSRVEVPPDLDRIVLKALAQNPAQRYQNAEEMAADLEALIGPGSRDIAEGLDAAAPSPGAPGHAPEDARMRGPAARASGAGWIDGPSIPLAVPELDRLVNPQKRAADREVFATASDQEQRTGTLPLPKAPGEPAGTAREAAALRHGEIVLETAGTPQDIGGSRDGGFGAEAGAPPEAGPRVGARASHGPSHAFPSRQSWRRRTLMMVGGGGILLASIAIVAVSKLGTLRGPALTKPAYDSVAVLPMKNLGLDASQSQHLAEGMGQSLSAKLSQLSRLRVTPWATSRRFAERGRTIQEIGQSLNVDAVVASTFRKKDSRIEIVVSLMDAKTGSRAWSKSLEEPLSDLFTVQRRVAVELATRLWGKLTQDEERDLGSQPSASVEAYEDYLEGAHHAGKGQAEDDVALALFDKAIQLDPKLDEAYVGIGTVHLDHALGDSSDIRKSLEAAEGAFRNALQLAATNLSARRGMIKIFWLRGQPEECLKTGREIPKGRDMTEVLTARAEAYLYGGLCDQAAPLLKRAIELDPQNQDAHFSLVHALAWSGQFRQAVEAGEAYLRGFGDDPRIRLTIGQSFRGIGELARARDQYVTIAQQTPDDPANQLFADEGRLDKALGDPDRARETWEAGTAVLKRHLKAHRKIAETRFHLAELYALLGHGDLFEQELARARKERGALPDDPNEAIAGYVALDEKDRALEGLHRRLAAGRLGQFWFNVERLSTSGLENMPGYNQLIKEYNARQEGLRQVY